MPMAADDRRRRRAGEQLSPSPLPPTLKFRRGWKKASTRQAGEQVKEEEWEGAAENE